MTSEVVLLIAILCLVKCTWCVNYGFALGQRHSNDEILNEELLTSNDDSNETTIEYAYTTEKPVSYMQLRTDTNVYTEVSFLNSTKIYVKLSNFENMRFNATLTVYGFPWHPDGPKPNDDIQLLLQPSERKEIYLSKSSVEESDIIATNGAYLSKELSKSKKESNEKVDKSGDSSKYYNYDYVSTLEKTDETDAEDPEPEPIIVVDDINQSVVLKANFFIYIFPPFLLSFKV